MIGADPRRNVAPTPTPPISTGLSGLRVLVVDDDSDSREMLGALLTASGASVQTAASAAEALQLAAEQAPDVLISDIAMPGDDGYVLMLASASCWGRRCRASGSR